MKTFWDLFKASFNETIGWGGTLVKKYWWLCVIALIVPFLYGVFLVHPFEEGTLANAIGQIFNLYAIKLIILILFILGLIALTTLAVPVIQAVIAQKRNEVSVVPDKETLEPETNSDEQSGVATTTSENETEEDGKDSDEQSDEVPTTSENETREDRKKDFPKITINQEKLKTLFDFDEWDNASFYLFCSTLESKSGQYLKIEYGKLAHIILFETRLASKDRKFRRLNDSERSPNFKKFCMEFYKAIGVIPSSTDNNYYTRGPSIIIRQDFGTILGLNK